ncbi:MAG: hypothetical protein FMNOHCHN_03800 [Ignavibacteriaceae bacterium]|nr:hypothetical protein [Ignavibacteriaceae bacterium]
MRYDKFIYRRLDYLVDKAEKMLSEGKHLTPEFHDALKKAKDLDAQIKTLYTVAEANKLNKPNTPEWSATCRQAENLRQQSEKLLRDAVRSYLGPQFVNVHVLVGYCPQTIPYYQKMIKELRKTFPRAKTEDISLGKVTKSSCVQGFTLITYSTEASFIETNDEYSKYKLDAPDGKSYRVSESCEYYW